MAIGAESGATRAKIITSAPTCGREIPFESVGDCIAEIIRVFSQRSCNTRALAKLMAAVRTRLCHGQWTALCKSRRLPFSKKKADMLVSVGKNIADLNEQTFAQLPHGWSILYQLSRLDRARLLDLIRDGAIHSGLTLQEAKELSAKQKPSKSRKGPKPNVRQRFKRFEDYILVFPLTGLTPNDNGRDAKFFGWQIS